MREERYLDWEGGREGGREGRKEGGGEGGREGGKNAHVLEQGKACYPKPPERDDARACSVVW